MSNSKELVTLVVMMFLLVILICSSVTKFEVFARPPATATSCVVVKPTAPGAVYAERCCDTTTYFNSLGQPTHSSTDCQVCQYSGGGSLVDCSTVFNTGNTGGFNHVPPPTNALPTSSISPTGNNTSIPPALSITKEHNLGSPKGFSSPAQKQQPTTNTCPDGSQPDANGNCPTSPPPTATNQQVTPPTTTTTSSHHHHKGSNNLQGQEPMPTTTGTTETKKGKVPKTH